MYVVDVCTQNVIIKADRDCKYCVCRRCVNWIW